jgi:hypothetical protein
MCCFLVKNCNKKKDNICANFIQKTAHLVSKKRALKKNVWIQHTFLKPNTSGMLRLICCGVDSQTHSLCYPKAADWHNPIVYHFVMIYPLQESLESDFANEPLSHTAAHALSDGSDYGGDAAHLRESFEFR